jgi:hypothetical protein
VSVRERLVLPPQRIVHPLLRFLLVYTPAWNRILPPENPAQQRGDGGSPLIGIIQTPWLGLTEKLGRFDSPSDLSRGRNGRNRV